LIKHLLLFDFCPFWLGRIAIIFTLFGGQHLLLGRQIFTKWRSEKHSADLTMIETSLMIAGGLTERFSASTELYNACTGT
jgi:hypothetical protein